MPSCYPGIYVGRVEKRVDPQRQGRLKVRIVGIHGPQIKVEHLPWSYPKNNAWANGGSFKVPPLYSYVYIQFQKGHHEYPVWEQGWWGQPDGKKLETNDSSFGGAVGTGRLQIDPDNDTDPANQPNNFFDSSVNGKNLQLDDRKKRERVVLADQLDNMLFINTEHGVLTLEAAAGLRQGGYKKHGLTLSAYDQAIQFYTFKGWRFTMDTIRGTAELCAPIGHKIRIETTGGPPKDGEKGTIEPSKLFGIDQDSPQPPEPPDEPEKIPEPEVKERLEFWTAKGNRIIVDEEKEIIVVKTANQRFIVLDDAKVGGHFAVQTLQHYFFMADGEESGEAELRVTGNLKIKATGDMGFSCGGKMTLDGVQGVFFNEDAPDIPAEGPNYDMDVSEIMLAIPRVNHELPDNMEEIDRANDHEYYNSV